MDEPRRRARRRARRGADDRSHGQRAERGLPWSGGDRRRRRLAVTGLPKRRSGLGARVVRLPRLGKGQALTLGEAEAAAGSCSLRRRPGRRPALAGRVGSGSGHRRLRREAGRWLRHRQAGPPRSIRALSGFEAREPLSGQRALTAAARRSCFPLAAGFGCEVRMTVDAARAGLEIEERELAVSPRHGTRSGGLPAPRPPTARRAPGLRAARRQLSRASAAARRLDARRERRRRGHGDRGARPGRRPGQARSVAFALTYGRGEPRECSSWSGSRSSACSRPAS